MTRYITVGLIVALSIGVLAATGAVPGVFAPASTATGADAVSPGCGGCPNHGPTSAAPASEIQLADGDDTRPGCGGGLCGDVAEAVCECRDEAECICTDRCTCSGSHCG